MAKPAITFRSVKDAALSYTELDTNFTNLKDATIGFTSLSTDRIAKSVTAFGNAAYSTVEKKFGTGSVAFDGTGDYITVPTDTDFAYGTNAFTIEMWVYRTVSGAVQILLDQRTASPTNYAPFLFIGTTNVITYSDGAATVITGATTVPLNAWSHVALSRSGTSTRLFLNGVQQGSTYTDTRNYIQTPISLGMRFDGVGSPFTGYIDEVRISKGIARYTANFTAPSAAFTNDANTVLLLHADSTPIVDDPGVTAVNADIDLNSRLNLTAGTGITLALDPTTDTLTITNTQPAPDLSNYVTLDGTQTVTGAKSFTANTTLKSYAETVYNLGTTGGTIAPDVANGSVQKITLNSALTINAFTNPISGQSLTLIIYGGTAYTSITSTMKFSLGSEGKELTATLGCIDVLNIFYDGTTYFASMVKDYQ